MGRGKRWDVIAEFIQKRDKNQCRKCGRSGSDKVLNVHHLRREEDIIHKWDPHLPTNLVTLCRSCHKILEDLNIGKQLSACQVETHSDLILSARLRRRLNNQIRLQVSNRAAQIHERDSRRYTEEFDKDIFDFNPD